jgi:hypothetical protein
MLKKAFQTLSSIQNDCIEWDKLEDSLCNKSEKLKYDEIESFQEYVGNSIQKQKFYFDSYVKTVCSNPDQNQDFSFLSQKNIINALEIQK